MKFEFNGLTAELFLSANKCYLDIRKRNILLDTIELHTLTAAGFKIELEVCYFDEIEDEEKKAITLRDVMKDISWKTVEEITEWLELNYSYKLRELQRQWLQLTMLSYLIELSCNILKGTKK